MSQYIEKKHAIHTFSPDHVPAAGARHGEIPILETYDCYTGQFLRGGSDFDHMDKSLASPAIEPVYIEGAYPQDIPRLTVRDVELDQVGILDEGSTVGALKEYFPEYIIRRLPVKDGMVHHGRLQIPVRPMIGVTGTASKGHAVNALVLGDHGGSMDYASIGSDVILCPSVRMSGALPAVGDLHAIMGDGECGNCDVETGGRVTIRVGMVKNHPIPWPLMETGDHWITAAFRENVDEICQKAADQMLTFLTVETGLFKLDAGIFIDMLENLMVCQIINPQKTVRLRMSKWPLEKLGFYGLTDQESITRGLEGEQEVCP